MLIDLDKSRKALEHSKRASWNGRVRQAKGLLVQGEGVRARVGAIVSIQNDSAETLAQVIGFDQNVAFLMPLGDMRGVEPGASIAIAESQDLLPSGSSLLGRVIDPFGKVLDEGPQVRALRCEPISRAAPNPLKRMPISQRLDTGVRIINATQVVGIGQRMGIYAGAGIGKSTLLGMLAKHVDCDAVVLGLIGERGREVREFLDVHLGAARARSVCVVATSDTSPVVRVRAASAATTIAESLRAEGKNVLLLLDSLTRVALAQREIGLSAGEPPTTKGFPPSAFALLAPLIERAGCGVEGEGSITAFYSVLVEGDEMSEDPVADVTRGLLDGHIILSRRVADRGLFPAVDFVASQSRLMPILVDKAHIDWAREARQLRAAYQEAEDLITMGAYRQGSNPAVDKAIAHHEALDKLVMQRPEQKISYSQSAAALHRAISDSSKGAPS